MIPGTGRGGSGSALHRAAGVLPVAFLFALWVPSAAAEPIVGEVSLLSRVYFTDNLFLSSQGQEAAAVFQLLPNIAGGRSGNRASYRYYYGPSALFYAGGHSDLNRVFQVLQADGTLQLIDEYLGLTASARANQSLIDAGEQPAGFDAVGNPDAFTQTASVQIAPVITFPMLRGDFATVRLTPGINYAFSADTAGGNGRSGSFGSQSSLAIGSGKYFSRMPWSVTAQTNVFNRNDGQSGNEGTSSVDGTLTYSITPRWQIQGLVGYDHGDYESLSRTSGGRWRITPNWSPSRNTSIALGYGWRYFGTDYFANVSWTHKKTSLSFSYETTVSTGQSAIVDADVVAFEDAFGEPIANPAASQDLSGSVSNPALVSGVYVQNQMSGTLAHRFGRSVGTFAILRNRWDYQSSGSQVEQTQGTLSVNRSLNQKTSGTLGLQYWIYSQSGNGDNDFSQVGVWSQVSYRVSRRLTSEVRYNYTQRSTDAADLDYTQNGLWLTLNWTL